MVKSARLWREISQQYAKLAEAEAVADEHHRPQPPPSSTEQVVTVAPRVAEKAPAASFYDGGLQHKHWVLLLCSLMITCEWVDRSVLSIAMQPIKDEFGLTDTQIGMMASSSLWTVPVAIGFAGRLADHVPKAKLLGLGVFGWGACTMLTGFARSFPAIILSRLAAGLSNCAGYPVAIALLAEFFGPAEMTTAIGYFYSGMAIGGLLGLAVGGTLITQFGWRWAFWGVSLPQLIVALLLSLTVRSSQEPPPKRPWLQDLKQMSTLPTLKLLACSAVLTGLGSGNNRFISSLAERLHGVDARTIGSVMGVVMGLTGVVAAWCGGHAVERCARQEPRALLWCASCSDVLHVAFGTCALLAPNFGLLVVFSALSACGGSLSQGVDTAIQQLARGRRGTTQSLMELSWSLGMAAGPFVAGLLSDSIEGNGCDEGCALRAAVMLVGGLCHGTQCVVKLVAARHFLADRARVDAEDGEKPEPEGKEPVATTVGRSAES